MVNQCASFLGNQLNMVPHFFHLLSSPSFLGFSDDIARYQHEQGFPDFVSLESYHKTRITDRKVDLMHYFDDQGYAHREDNAMGPYLPMWQTSPFVNASQINHNILHEQDLHEIVAKMIETGSAYFSGMLKAPPGSVDSPDPRTSLFADYHSLNARREPEERAEPAEYMGDPFAELFVPVFDSFDPETRQVKAVMVIAIQWEEYLEDILPENIKGIEVVIDRECGGVEENETADLGRGDEHSAFTFVLNGKKPQFVGYGDQHEGYNEWMRYGNLIKDNLDDGSVDGITIDGQCSYDIHVFPSSEFKNDYMTATPAIITVSIAATFLFTIMMFMLYDILVERRQKIVLSTANKTTAIVSSLFPKVRPLLMVGLDNAHATSHKKFLTLCYVPLSCRMSQRG